MTEQLSLKYVPLSTCHLWDENPKLHDLQLLVESFERYGFQDPPKFSEKLNSRKGGIVEGNGRITALNWMKKQGRLSPVGIIASDGDWNVPILFGNDLKSEHLAKAYALDHNSLTLAGADFDLLDLTKIWDEETYKGVLLDLGDAGELPVSMDGDGLDALLKVWNNEIEFPEYDESAADDVEFIECPKCGEKFPK